MRSTKEKKEGVDLFQAFSLAALTFGIALAFTLRHPLWWMRESRVEILRKGPATPLKVR